MPVLIQIVMDCPLCEGRGCSVCHSPTGTRSQSFALDEELEHHYLMGKPIEITAQDNIKTGESRFEIRKKEE